MSDIKYSVEFHPVIYKKYKQGAPKHLLKKVGRWQKHNGYGFENIDYTPNVITDNKLTYENAPVLMAKLEMAIAIINDLYPSNEAGVEECNEGEFIAVNNWLFESMELINRIKGDNNEDNL